MLVRLLLGLLKGAVLGVALGLGADHLGLGRGFAYLLCGATGFLVGLFVGRPIWSHLLDKKSTVVTSLLKGLVGVGVGVGVYALVRNVLPDPTIALAGEARPLSAWLPIVAGLAGGLYGAFVEVDDAPARPRNEKSR